jgi:hypothetical protein
MTLGDKAQRLERRLTRTVNAAVHELVGKGQPAPLEIVHAVLDRAEERVQDLGRGRRVFPFNRVRVLVLTDPRDRESRARISAVVDGPPSLGERLIERVKQAGCAVADVATDVDFRDEAGPDWEQPAFHVEFDRVAPSALAAPSSTPANEDSLQLRLAVLKGSAGQHGYIFTGGRIDLGRRAEVLDQQQRLIRTNHVAFAEDGPDANRSVSRRHAHIEYDAAQRCYRLWDDRSAHGTSVVRAGRTIKVPAAARGIRLEAGDEIVLGHARLQVTFVTPGVEPAT